MNPDVHISFSAPEDETKSFFELFGISFEEFLELSIEEQEQARIDAIVSATEQHVLECSLHTEGLNNN